jgi:TonB-linked SusC/RagA family outer membrane protein
MEAKSRLVNFEVILNVKKLNMHKIIFSLLCIVITSAKVLVAQDSNPSKPSTDIKSSSQKDSIVIIPQAVDRQVNIPFATNTYKYISGDVSVINSEELQKYDNVNSVVDVISGRVPGLYGGLNLRGSGNALVVIDGIPRPISSVTISEIEQIIVLKDVNSAILYGVRANNGVILITTKRGQPKSKKISTLFETGLDVPISYPKYLGSADYMELYNEALTNDGLIPLYSQGAIDGTRNGSNPYKYPDANYLNSTFLKSFKPTSRVQTEFSGGNQNAQYYANIGWQGSGSLMKMGNTFRNDRLNIRSNMNFRINDFITSHVDIATVFNKANVPNREFFGEADSLKPNYYPPLIDTSLVSDKEQIKTARLLGRLVNGKYLLGGTSLYRNNIYGDLLFSGYSKQYSTTGMFNVGLDFDLKSILKGLTLKTYTSFDFYNQFTVTQINNYAVYEPQWLTGSAAQDSLVLTKIGVDKAKGTQGITNSNLTRNFAFYGILNYSRMFGEKNAFSAMLLGYMDKYNLSGVFQSDKHTHLGASLNYVYADKYMVNFTSALVSSAKLSSQNRVALSPSVALGWIISNENFLQNNSFVDYLKLKVSAGIVNTDVNLTQYYAYDDIWQNVGYTQWGDGTRNSYPTSLINASNTYLTYEKRKEITIGAEAVLLNKSLSINVNYFIDNRADQIVYGLSNTYPSYLGSLNPAVNFNEERFSGLELGVSLKKSVNEFNIDIEPSIFLLNTDVVKKDEFYGLDYLYRAGKPIGAIFGLESLGLFQSQEEIDNSPKQMFGVVRPGDIKYKDQNNDGIIDENDEKMIGNSLDNFIGDLIIRMNYKNITLFVLTSARFGSNAVYSNPYYWVDGNLKYSDVVLNRWTPATSGTATYPRLSSMDNSNNFRPSTYWLEGNSVVSLRRVQLTYDLPPALASKLFTKNLSVYFTAGNLLNIAKNKDKMELSIGTEPQYRNYLFGLRASF